MNKVLVIGGFRGGKIHKRIVLFCFFKKRHLTEKGLMGILGKALHIAMNEDDRLMEL